MGRDFSSSLGAGLDSGFDAGISALGVGFGSGFDSGFSVFGFTVVVLLFLLPPQGASPGKARKIVEQALKMKTLWRLLNTQQGGALDAPPRPGIPDRRS
jgi:hypothetical protein